MPLARLLVMAYRDLVEQLHERLSQTGWDDVRPAYGFVLLAARAGTPSISDLAARLEVSKQAASKLAESMAASGYLTYTADAGDNRVKRVELADRGHQLLAAVEEIYAELEEQWAATIGLRQTEQLRRNLETVIRSRHHGGLPAVRPAT